MKFNKRVTSSRRKQRKAYFKSPPHIRRIRMSSILSKELRNKFGIRSLPIHKDDEVLVRTGSHKGHEGKVTRVYRKKYVIFIDRIVRKKASGQVVSIGIHPSNVMITKIKTDKDREALINRLGKAKRKALKNKGTKFTDTEVEAQAPVVVENIE